jgi:Protein of unknown function (DUF2530)
MPERPARKELKTPPEPVQVDSQRVVLIGTAIWFVAFVALLPFYDWLGQHGHRIWLWTCLAGWILGLLGLPLIRRHRNQGRTG